MKSFNQMKKDVANKVRQSVHIIDNNTSAVVGIVATGFMTIGQAAHAALPTEAATAFTTLSGNVTDVLAAVWPIAALSVGGFVLLRLFKKGANRAI